MTTAAELEPASAQPDTNNDGEAPGVSENLSDGGTNAGKRKLGTLRDKMWAAPDAWDPDPELESLFLDEKGNPRSAWEVYLDAMAKYGKGGA